MQEDGTFDVLPKKEVIALKKEMDKLQMCIRDSRSTVPQSFFMGKGGCHYD